MSATTTTPLPTTPAASAVPFERPRLRVGAIVWGVFVIAIASLVLWVTGDDTRREGFLEWVTTLTPGGFALVGVLVLGALLLLAGVLAAIRGPRARA